MPQKFSSHPGKIDIHYEGFVDKISNGTVIGWVKKIGFDEPLPINVYSNGALVGSGMADQYRQDLEIAGKGNGRHAFSISVPNTLPLDGLRVEALGVGNVPFSFAMRAVLDSSMGLPVAAASKPPSHALAPLVEQSNVWIDISDFLFYLSHHKTVSGIQRVQCEIIRSIINNGWSRYKFCITTPAYSHYYHVPEHILQTLLARIDVNAMVPEAEWISYVTMIADVGRLQHADIVADDMLFLLGAFWVFPELPFLLASLRSQGVHIGVYAYDLIPLYYPEYCEIELVKTFSLNFALIAQIADLFLTISRHTANEVELFYRLTGQTPKTIRPVLLAHELRHRPPEEEHASNASNALRVVETIDGPYVLCVCTIEVRKNHLYLFRIWRELLKKHGKNAIPKLVLIGRRGWRVNDLFAQLETTRYLDGHIRIMSGLDNSELETLYKHCLFTVFPSFNEGWGLPVGESLVYGKLCVASHATSVPEVGKQFAIYIDPDNVTDGLRTIEKVIFDRTVREEAEANIRTHFVPRTWNDVAKTFVGEIESYLRGIDKTKALLPPGRLRCGEVVMLSRPNDLCSTEDIVRTNPTSSLVCTQGWHGVEAGGIWGHSRSSQIAFVLDTGGRPPPARVRVYLKAKTPPWVRNCTLLITGSCGASSTFTLGESNNYLFNLDCAPQPVDGSRSCIRLTLQLDREFAPVEPEVRQIGIGLQAIMVVDADDVMQRIDAFEKLVAATVFS